MRVTCSRSRQPARKASHTVFSSSTNRARRSELARLRCTMRTLAVAAAELEGAAPSRIGACRASGSPVPSAPFGRSQKETTVPMGPHRKRTARRARWP
eukprot:4646503-Prymnesium_polylepis.2